MSLPTPMPNRSMAPPEYIQAWNTLLAALPQFEMDMNAAAANSAMTNAGTAFALPYIFDSATAAADPGLGKIRLNASTPGAAFNLYIDLFGANGLDYTPMLNGFGYASSAVKGHIRIVKVGDSTKWSAFSMTGLADNTGYKTITANHVMSSVTTPFENGDQVLILFTRNGDIGPAGTINRRLQSVTTTSSAAVDINNWDMYAITALSQSCTFAAPTGTMTDGRSLLIRVKDDGTARTLLYSSSFRASVDLPLPTSTAAGKTLYMGFLYNLADAKWDLVSVLNNV